MTQRLKLLRDALAEKITVWRSRAEKIRRARSVANTYETCASELEAMLAKVEEELSARAARGWQTRKRNERARAKAEKAEKQRLQREGWD